MTILLFTFNYKIRFKILRSYHSTFETKDHCLYEQSVTLLALFALHHCCCPCFSPPCDCLHYNTSILHGVLLYLLKYTVCHGITVNNVVPPYIHIPLPIAIFWVREAQFLQVSLDLCIHCKTAHCYILKNHNKPDTKYILYLFSHSY